MSVVLELTHLVQQHRMPQMKVWRRWIESCLDLEWSRKLESLDEFGFQQDFVAASAVKSELLVGGRGSHEIGVSGCGIGYHEHRADQLHSLPDLLPWQAVNCVKCSTLPSSAFDDTTITKKSVSFLHRQHCMDQRVKHETKFKTIPARLGGPTIHEHRTANSGKTASEQRGGNVRGAIRLAVPSEARRRADLRYWMKISAGLMFATGGVLVATTSTGTVELTDQPRAPAQPAINFNFTDLDDALGKPAAPSKNPAPAELATLDTGERTESKTMLASFVSGVDEAEKADEVADGVKVGVDMSADPLSGGSARITAPAAPAAPAATSSSPFTNDDGAKDDQANNDKPAIAKQPHRTDTSKAPAPEAAPDEKLSTSTIRVAAGDTLSAILNDQGLGLTSIRKLLADALVTDNLTRLAIGQAMEVTRAPDGRFMSLSTRSAVDQRITVERSDDGFTVAEVDLPLEKERVVTSGTIQNSLYLAAAEAKLKQSTIMALADIFQWELDFARDIRKGDQFALVYDRLYRDGQYIGDGDILAAEFIRGGRTYQAMRFTTDDGVSSYYSPDGQSMRRTFLRHPVDVVRVTSRFDPNRLHPVLHQIRAHRGVDYGSPYGTPIRATADGTISFAGEQSTYGNLVILQHGHEFSTLYAHMSKVADKSVTGVKVKQGDIIGYVGNTGRVTGTHLHYEFRVRGVHVDPLKVELPAAQPIAAEYRDALRNVSDEMIAQMQSVLPEQGNRLARR